MSRFQENFLEIQKKNANAKRREKIFRKFFHAFFKYRKYCGGVSILSNPPRYHYYQIHQGIDTIKFAKLSILLNRYSCFYHHHSTLLFLVYLGCVVLNHAQITNCTVQLCSVASWWKPGFWHRRSILLRNMD